MLGLLQWITERASFNTDCSLSFYSKPAQCSLWSLPLVCHDRYSISLPCFYSWEGIVKMVILFKCWNSIEKSYACECPLLATAHVWLAGILLGCLTWSHHISIPAYVTGSFVHLPCGEHWASQMMLFIHWCLGFPNLAMTGCFPIVIW